MARLLLATPHLPFPPRNGVTLPPAALARGLMERGHSVDVAWLRAAEVAPEGEEETRAAVSSMRELPLRTRPLPFRLLGQILGRRPAFDRWELGGGSAEPGPRPDLLWATPRSCLGAAMALRERAGWTGVPLVAAVNDVWTGVMRQRRAREEAGAGGPHLGLRRSEAALLGRADRVVVQSGYDREVAVEALGLDPDRVTRLPNGVSERLFDLPLERTRDAVGWVGDALNPHYRRSTERLLAQVWPKVRERHPRVRLLLAGPGTETLAGTGTGGVEVRGFVPALEDVYRPLRLLVAPIFKGHGRINKVAEAMAAGVPVVGDATAFHGMDGFHGGVHGVVADDWEGLGPALCAILDDPGRAAATARAARALASASFRWSDRVDRVEGWLRGRG